MAELDLPTSHLEFVPDDEIIEQKRLAKLELERKYFDDCTMLRAGIVGLLMKHGALHAEGGWALFYLDDIDGDDGVVTISGRNEVLIVVGTGNEVHEGKLKVADIRIYTNQHFRTIDGQITYLTQDFTLDEDNDCQYVVDQFSIADDGTINLEGSLAPLFMLTDEGNIDAANITPFTLPHSFTAIGSDGEEAQITPFGFFKVLEDALYALSEGTNLFNSIKDIPPHAVKTNL